MTSKTDKKAAPVQPKAASKTNCSNCTTCMCGKQATLNGIPPHREGDNPLTDFLETHPGWWSRQNLCTTLYSDERTLRLLAEHSAGRVIFSSGNGGLCATIHAQPIEARACAAELRARGMAHFSRAVEIEGVKGGAA